MLYANTGAMMIELSGLAKEATNDCITMYHNGKMVKGWEVSRTAKAVKLQKVCERCGGSGLTVHLHVQGGVCFECEGTGKGSTSNIKVLTVEEQINDCMERIAKAAAKDRRRVDVQIERYIEANKLDQQQILQYLIEFLNNKSWRN